MAAFLRHLYPAGAADARRRIAGHAHYAAFLRAAGNHARWWPGPSRTGEFELAFAPEDAARIAAKKQTHRLPERSRIAPEILGNDVSAAQGCSIAWACAWRGRFISSTTSAADSATDTKKWGGLSPMGRDFVALANDLGIVLDASHASDDVFDQMSDLSRTAIICSHSGCRAVHDHPRNLDDARIKRLAASGQAAPSRSIPITNIW